MTKLSHSFCALLVTLLIATLHPGAATAAYPDKPLRMLVGFSVGGSADFVARLVAQKLAEKLGQPVLVDNRPGADGIIAAAEVAQAAPNGYTLLWITSAYALTPSQYTLNYDPVKSFAPLSKIGSSTNGLHITSSIPASSVPEFIAYAKQQPGKLNFAANGTADPSYLAAELFMRLTGISMVAVNYQGGGQVMAALLGGEVQVFFGSLSTTAEQVKAGKLKVLAVTSRTRSVVAPDLPTIAEAANLPTYESDVWYGVLATAGIPKDAQIRLHDELAAVVTQSDVSQVLLSRGFVPGSSSPEELGQTIIQDIARWAPFLKRSDAK